MMLARAEAIATRAQPPGKARSTIRHTFAEEQNFREKTGAGVPLAHPAIRPCQRTN